MLALAATVMKDRHKLNLVYLGEENTTPYLKAQEITDDVYSATELCIVNFAMDFPVGISSKHKKEIEHKWMNLLPRLDQIRALSVRQRVNQDFFEAICNMNNLEHLHFWTSKVEDIPSISKLPNPYSFKFERVQPIDWYKPNSDTIKIETTFSRELI